MGFATQRKVEEKGQYLKVKRDFKKKKRKKFNLICALSYDQFGLVNISVNDQTTTRHNI